MTILKEAGGEANFHGGDYPPITQVAQNDANRAGQAGNLYTRVGQWTLLCCAGDNAAACLPE